MCFQDASIMCLNHSDCLQAVRDVCLRDMSKRITRPFKDPYQVPSNLRMLRVRQRVAFRDLESLMLLLNIRSSQWTERKTNMIMHHSTSHIRGILGSDFQ